MKNYSAKIKIEPSENVDKPNHKTFCWILQRAELCIFIDSLITIGIVYNKLEQKHDDTKSAIYQIQSVNNI